MNDWLLAAMTTEDTAMIAGGSFLLVLLAFIFVMAMANRYMKVGPNQALIISGKGGFRIKKGGGTFVWPIIEKVDVLSLEIMTLDVRTPEVYTITGVPIKVDSVAQIKIGGDEASIRTAAERFLTRSLNQVQDVALQTLEGHLRAIIGTMTVEEIYKNRDVFAQQVQGTATADLANMGLTIDSFTLRDIKDDQGYLDALGRPRTAAVKKDAIVGQAIADQEATEKSSAANQAAQEAKFAAEAEVARARRDYESKQAEYTAAVNTKKAEADLAYDLQRFKTSQVLKVEEVKVLELEKEKQIEVQGMEVRRRERELEATVEKPAAAEQRRIQILANAEKYKLEAEAEGQAEAARRMGQGEADAERAKGLAAAEVTRARGMAEADVIRARGEAEAEAMHRKADAWRQYNEAAVTQMFIDKLPEITRAVAEPLAKTEKIVLISTGGNATGASQITQDVINIVSQVPPILEALAGVDLKKLVERVPKIGDPPKPPKTDPS